MEKTLFQESFPKNNFGSPRPVMKAAGIVVRVCLVYLGLNVLGLFIAKLFHLDRPLFNLDYLLAGLVFVWISRSLAALFLMGLFIVEFIRYWIPTYFFSAQAFSVVFWLRTAANWPPLILLAVMAAGLLSASVLVILFRRYKLSLREKFAATAALFSLGLLVIFADVLNGSNSIWRRGTNFFDLNISTSSSRLVAIQTWNMIAGKPATFTPIHSGQSATEQYFSELSSLPETTNHWSPAMISPEHLPEKIVVVVVESFSVLAADTNLNRWLQPFASLQNRYTIERGSFDWVGATLRGEIRELCWQSVDGTQILGATSKPSIPAALPTALKNLGYQTTSLHGFYKTMYERDKVYPMLGFDKSVFLDDMRADASLPYAGTLFRGAQDSYVANLVHQEILQPGKRMVYWMTLSSHFPVNVPFARQIATPDELRHAAELPSPVWGHTVICRKVLESIAKIAADPALPDCDFIIVGDHSIPLTDNELKKFYVSNHVPYLILRHIKSDRPAVAITP